jgi:hypothetical protein
LGGRSSMMREGENLESQNKRGGNLNLQKESEKSQKKQEERVIL